MTDARDGADRASSPFDEWLADDPEVAELSGPRSTGSRPRCS